MRKGITFLLAIFYSSLTAAIAFLFLQIESRLTDFLWVDIVNKIPIPKWLYTIIIVLLAAQTLIMLRKHYGDIPETSAEVSKRLDLRTKAGNYKIWQNIVATLIVLVVGAGIGPEATLLGIIVALSIWQTDKVRYFYFNYNEIVKLSLGQQLKIIFTINNYLKIEKIENFSRQKLVKILLIINGLVVFIILSSNTDGEGFVTKLGNSMWKFSELWIILPVALIVLVFSIFYKYINNYIVMIFRTIKNDKIKVYIGACAIIIISLLMPNLLFSGQHTMHLVAEEGLSKSAIYLLGAAIVKLVFLIICLNSGWKGGDIFPLIFAGLLQGYALAKIFSGVDSILVIAVAATVFLALVVEHPPVAVILLMLFFPVNVMPVIFIVGMLVIFTKKYVGKFYEKE